MTKKQRRIAAHNAAVTRRFYLFEKECIKMGADTPIRTLRRLAQRIWREHSNRGDRCPTIIAGDGCRQNDRWISYCEGRCRIVLARHERRIPVLIHEMAHALGPVNHGRSFEKRFFVLMDLYWKGWR